jgi:4-hydroxybenzoate polyprenyltransferase
MNLARRLWIYQAERFPLAAHGLLVAALVLGSVGFATAGAAWPSGWVLAAAFVVTLGFFLQLRIFDEFKDAADDAVYRPYRPVPRGLVSLRELRLVGLAVAALQLALTVWVDRMALLYLVLVWGGIGLLGREFFVGDWLRRHPLVYLFSHMIILPLILLYGVALAWPVGPPSGLGWFLGAGYANGVVFEIGRKLRAPQDEEPGVETYSVLWGIGRASAAWWLAVLAAGMCAVLAGAAIDRVGWLAVTALAGGIGCGWVAWQMARRRSSAAARWIELASALWVLTLYVVFAVAAHWV